MDATQTNRPGRGGGILVRGVNWLGDAVMSSPALQRLREHFPETTLTILTHEKMADLWLHHGSVDRVITFASGESPWAIARRLGACKFESALIFPNSPRSALESWLARIPQRVGYARPWRNWLLTRPLPPRPGRLPMRKRNSGEIRRLIRTGNPAAGPDPDPNNLSGSMAHHIHDYLHLASALGADATPVAPRFQVSAEETSVVRQRWIAGLAPGPGVLLGLNPSAAYGPAKCWPADRFKGVMQGLAKARTDVTCLVFGSAEDRGLCQEIAKAAGERALNLAGKTSLRELMSLLSLCQVVLTNDSGPMHLAAALGTPVVVPFGSTSAELTGPGLPGSPGHAVLQTTVACAPCYRRVCPIDFRCMKEITVERVVSAVLSFLNRPATR